MIRRVIPSGPGGSDELSVAVVRPEGVGPWPGVVMIHEAWGLDDVLLRQAQRLASAGFLVVAPDLLGRGLKLACMISVFRALQAQRGRPFVDVEACQQLLRSDPDCTGRTGVIGFCMGGGFALVLGARGFDVSAVNYGLLPKDLEATVQDSCPVVASYGGADKGLAGAAAKLEGALTAAGVPHDVKEYEGAGHSFLNDAENGPRLARPLMRVAGAGPHPEAATDAWRRIEAFFSATLKS